MTGYSVVFTLSKHDWLEVEDALSELFEAIVVKPERDGDPQSPEVVTLIFPEEPNTDLLQEQLSFVFESMDLHVPRVKVEKLPDVDWLQHVYDGLKPIDAGRFFVHGSHITKNIPDHTVNILIEAASAFGTGEHPTTKGCLLMLDKYLDTEKPAKHILDMGVGSGILAIAAARTMPDAKPIIGVDIDPGSIRVAENHARDNGVEHQITMVAGDGFRVPLVQEQKPYDLIFANILAQPLIDMSEDMVKVAGRHIILSGFTDVQKPYVYEAYKKLGCVEKDSIVIDGWVALWLTKK